MTLRDSDYRFDSTGIQVRPADQHGLASSVDRYDHYGQFVDAEEGGVDIAKYWRILVKHRWVILTSVLLALAAGAAATLLTTPIYRAEVTLQIDREAIRVVKDDTAPTEQMIAGDEFFQTQYGILKSRQLAIRTVDSLGLAQDDRFLHTMGSRRTNFSGTPAGQAVSRRNAVLLMFSKHFGVTPVRGSRLVHLTFDSPDSRLAAQIVNATAENYIASNLDRKVENSSYARQFLETKLAQAKANLEESEHEAVDYATSQQIINLPTGSSNSDNNTAAAGQSLVSSSLAQINTALSTARADRIRAEQRWQQAQSAAGLSLPESLKNVTIQELSQTRAKAQAEYTEKLQTLKPTYPDMLQLKSRVDELDKQIQIEVKNVQASLQNDYNVALANEKALETQVNQLKGSVMTQERENVQLDILQRQSDTNKTLYEGLLQRYKEVDAAGGSTSNNIYVIDRAEAPLSPFKPQPLSNMAIALAAGLALGIVLAFLIELLDESIGFPEDIEAKLGLPMLGSVPILDKNVVPSQALTDVRSAFSEAYYSIRTALQFSSAEGAPRTLLVTSSRPAEGKSTTAIALAVNFARLGIRVLLVDGDLRNPSLHRSLGRDSSVGLSNVLTGSSPLQDVLQSTDYPGLTFVPCGPLPPNPAELLAGPRLKPFLAQVVSQFDMLVIDGPPVLGLADAPMLAASVSGTVFVLEAGKTRRGLAKAALRRLRTGNARILGAVLTKFNVKKASYGAGYAYAYDYNYGSTPRVETKS